MSQSQIRSKRHTGQPFAKKRIKERDKNVYKPSGTETTMTQCVHDKGKGDKSSWTMDKYEKMNPKVVKIWIPD